MQQLKIGLEEAKQDHEPSKMDIRNWFYWKQTNSASLISLQNPVIITSDNIDTSSDYDSDDTETAFLRDYPDENPKSNTWYRKPTVLLRIHFNTFYTFNSFLQQNHGTSHKSS